MGAGHLLVGGGEVKRIGTLVKEHRCKIGTAGIEQLGIFNHIAGRIFLDVDTHTASGDTGFCHIGILGRGGNIIVIRVNRRLIFPFSLK